MNRRLRDSRANRPRFAVLEIDLRKWLRKRSSTRSARFALVLAFIRGRWSEGVHSAIRAVLLWDGWMVRMAIIRLANTHFTTGHKIIFKVISKGFRFAKRKLELCFQTHTITCGDLFLVCLIVTLWCTLLDTFLIHSFFDPHTLILLEVFLLLFVRSSSTVWSSLVAKPNTVKNAGLVRWLANPIRKSWL